jgi:hypothetical protein
MTGTVTFLGVKRWSLPTELGPKGEAVVAACRPIRHNYSKLRLRLK